MVHVSILHRFRDASMQLAMYQYLNYVTKKSEYSTLHYSTCKYSQRFEDKISRLSKTEKSDKNLVLWDDISSSDKRLNAQWECFLWKTLECRLLKHSKQSRLVVMSNWTAPGVVSDTVPLSSCVTTWHCAAEQPYNTMIWCHWRAM